METTATEQTHRQIEYTVCSTSLLKAKSSATQRGEIIKYLGSTACYGSEGYNDYSFTLKVTI